MLPYTVPTTIITIIIIIIIIIILIIVFLFVRQNAGLNSFTSRTLFTAALQRAENC
jgi:preprotein translocase subunit SecG